MLSVQNFGIKNIQGPFIIACCKICPCAYAKIASAIFNKFPYFIAAFFPKGFALCPTRTPRVNQKIEPRKLSFQNIPAVTKAPAMEASTGKAASNFHFEGKIPRQISTPLSASPITPKVRLVIEIQSRLMRSSSPFSAYFP